MIELKPEERLDDLERNGYKIIQNPNKFCFGMDAVLLSGFAKKKRMIRFWTWGREQGSSLFYWKEKPEA